MQNNHNMSTTSILDMAGGHILLFPDLVFLSDGAWQLDTTQISLKML